jgi:hypothetical protein
MNLPTILRLSRQICQRRAALPKTTNHFTRASRRNLAYGRRMVRNMEAYHLRSRARTEEFRQLYPMGDTRLL